MDVPVSHRDLYFLRRAASDRPIGEVVRMRATHEWDPEAALVAEQYVQLYLRRDPATENCIFLGQEGCTIYGLRPRACRTFPFDQNPRGLLQIASEAKLLYDVCCDKDLVSRQDRKAAKHQIGRGVEEFTLYRELVAVWNTQVKDKPETQTLEAYADFLCRTVELGGAPQP
jgi:Fe-S-cluster containining protein